MLKQLINFYKVSSPGPCNGEALSSSDERRLKYLKWSTSNGLDEKKIANMEVCITFAALA